MGYGTWGRKKLGTTDHMNDSVYLIMSTGVGASLVAQI